MESRLPPDAAEHELGIAFLDLARFAHWCRDRTDREIAAVLQRFYDMTEDVLGAAGVRIVKFIGDAALVTFPPPNLRDVLAALERLRGRVRREAEESDFDTDLTCRVHLGRVVTGTFGAGASRHPDVIGRVVNEAAMLRGEGLVLSDAARRLAT